MQVASATELTEDQVVGILHLFITDAARFFGFNRSRLDGRLFADVLLEDVRDLSIDATKSTVVLGE